MKRIALGLVGVGVVVLTLVALQPSLPRGVTEPSDPPAVPAVAEAVETPPATPPALVVDDPDFLSWLLQPPDRAAAAITPDGWQVVVAVAEYGEGFVSRCAFSGLVWRDLPTGAEVKRLDLRKHLAPELLEQKPGPFGEETSLKYHRLLFAPSGKLIVAGGLSWPDPVKIQRYLARPELRYSSTIFIGANCYSASGFVWVIDPESGEVKKTLIRDRVGFVRDIELNRDGTKLLVRMPLPPRTRSVPSDDPPFVEVQQWDTATWTRDWVKMLDPAEAEKLRAGR